MRFAGLVFTVLALIFPFGAVSAQADTIKVDSLVIRGYELGQPSIDRLSGFAASVKARWTSNMVLMPAGDVDGTLFGSCKGNTRCNDDAQASLQLRRGREGKNSLVAAGLPAGRIIPTVGRVAKERGPEYRGVTIYLLVITSPVDQALLDSLGKLASTASDLRQQLAELQKSDSAQNALIASILNASKAEAVTQTQQKKDTIVIEKHPVIDGSIGVGFVALRADTIDVSTPTIQAELRPWGSFIGLFGVGGYRRFSAETDYPCSKRRDWFGALGLRIRISPAVGVTVGKAVAPETCDNGGPRRDGGWLTKYDNVRFLEVDVSPPGERLRVLGLKPYLAGGITHGTLKVLVDSVTINSAPKTGAWLRIGAKWNPNQNKKGGER